MSGPSDRSGDAAAWRRSRGLLAVLACVLVACETVVPTPSTRIATPSPRSDCIGGDLSGEYRRDFTAETTNNTDLLGAWTLAIEGCSYRISVDGVELGVGRIELVDGTAASGRVGLSDELLCPNEFAGVAFYDVTLDRTILSFAEAIQGTDQCEGRAEAFAGPPGWEPD